MNASFEHKNQAPARQPHHKESQNAIAFPSRTIVHAKLEMTEPGDQDEQEADTVANAVVSGEKISRKISGSAGSSSGIAVSQQMESQLSQLKGGGRQMPDGLRSMMESGFGQDFSSVRLHTDSEAASMSSSIRAKAFTHGNDIYFNQGQFSPETAEGQRLVAHELTHVVQGEHNSSIHRKINDNENENETIGPKPTALILYSKGHGSKMRKKQAEAVRTQLKKKKGKGDYYQEGGALNLQFLNVIEPKQFGNKQEFINAINEESNIDYLTVFSHAYPLGIICNDKEACPNEDDRCFTNEDVGHLNSSSFLKSANIYLNGCRNGASDNSLAQVMANHLDVRVWGFEAGANYIKKNKHTVYNGFMVSADPSKNPNKKGRAVHKEFTKTTSDGATVDFYSQTSISKSENGNLTATINFQYFGLDFDENGDIITKEVPQQTPTAIEVTIFHFSGRKEHILSGTFHSDENNKNAYSVEFPIKSTSDITDIDEVRYIISSKDNQQKEIKIYHYDYFNTKDDD